jgi:hypothetical protein
MIIDPPLAVFAGLQPQDVTIESLLRRADRHEPECESIAVPSLPRPAIGPVAPLFAARTPQLDLPANPGIARA